MTIPAASASFHGIWPALLTPLKPDLGIDLHRFGLHARSLIHAKGCGGVVPFGTTGEGPAFSVAERRDAVDALVGEGVPGSQILVSTSCAALPDTLALTRHALGIGAHGCLMMPPFYLKGGGHQVTDQGVIDSYRQVIDGAADDRLRLYLSHIPQVSGVGLSRKAVETLKRLYPQTIVGIKDSSGDTAHTLALADAFNETLMVTAGHEPDLPELARRGSTGAISGLANFMPHVVQRLAGRPDAPNTPHDVSRVRLLLAMLGPYALTPALKGIMSALSGEPGWLRVRAPLVALTLDQMHTLQHALKPIALDLDVD